MSSIFKLKGKTKTNGIEAEGTLTNGINMSGATMTAFAKLADGEGAVLGTLTNDTIGTTAEDGYLEIDIAGSIYKVPFWLDNA